MIVVCQVWTESERGWGRRSDGYSLHIDENERKAYVTKHNQEGDAECYSFADGEPYKVKLNANTKLGKDLAKNKSLRFGDKPPAGFREVRGEK